MAIWEVKDAKASDISDAATTLKMKIQNNAIWIGGAYWMYYDIEHSRFFIGKEILLSQQ